MTILNSYGQLLSAGMLGALPETAMVAIEGITASTEMMVRMVNALAELARLEDPDDHLALEVMDAEDVVAEAIEHVAMEAKLRESTITSECEHGLAIKGDRRRLILALTNLLGNAVKHGPTGSPIEVIAAREGGSVRFTVRDHGAGFPVADTGHLFDKYFRSVAERQRKVPGSGLGLYIVRTVAERHGGTVAARSVPGQRRRIRHDDPAASRGGDHMSTGATRTERDSMGEFEVPADAYYGANTMRAKVNFPISDLRLPRGFIRAIGLIKQQSALVNRELGLLDEHLAGAIIRAAQDVIDGALDDEFIVDVFQTGSGTSTNMNANEVIANRAIELLGGVRGSRTPVHPNDHVNLGQSSNDVIPTAIQVAAAVSIREDTIPGLRVLEDSLAAQVRGVLGGDQDRPNPSPGCDPDPARSGVPRLCRPDRASPTPL